MLDKDLGIPSASAEGSTTVSPGPGGGSATAVCPAGLKAVGGGYDSTPDIMILKNKPGGASGFQYLDCVRNK